MFHSSLGCSSISFRHQDLGAALRTIKELGFEEIDLGALPGVCDHVPHELDKAAVAAVSAQVNASGLRVRSVNGDIGDLNAVLDDDAQAARQRHLDALLTLTSNIGAKALVLPCGALTHESVRSEREDLDLIAAQLLGAGQRAAKFGVELWTESLHFLRFCWNLERAGLLADRLAGSGVGIVMDFSHIVASGEDIQDYLDFHAGRISHVHLRDAVPGNINLSIGNGQADFAGGLERLAAQGYAGHFSLELETRDVTNDERPAAAAKAASFITDLL
ncbi:Xylose isomerase domain protein TIM barrel [Pseudarthrobacter chlorophenolicus A6]|uniref:Xylose isomerase domain protein TIM barrel n=1 Tax=Pseudarthrobacter chlorophenolicus (strain ATCC 700700 / DSM 12829 / CIP 107037 / JCM 12360 / KCTC 9906 / NCIMB 13794 / A6) TaxID=452863 RepID=B8HAE7_PSECP|nr:sugar phosphate isomerase/epimerase [Pseudarthrobacter chlorophenolicus]ACL38408.1 Xylose isomerase domain protein TIM barrel [Pseudarthrobacter chlorophenolicus A6]SDQ49384.1 Sugar phosphate isomerase/epimerase [Pseudarthrobacter chlorophenolicus]